MIIPLSGQRRESVKCRGPKPCFFLTPHNPRFSHAPHIEPRILEQESKPHRTANSRSESISVLHEASAYGVTALHRLYDAQCELCFLAGRTLIPHSVPCPVTRKVIHLGGTREWSQLTRPPCVMYGQPPVSSTSSRCLVCAFGVTPM